MRVAWAVIESIVFVRKWTFTPVPHFPQRLRLILPSALPAPLAGSYLTIIANPKTPITHLMFLVSLFFLLLYHLGRVFIQDRDVKSTGSSHLSELLAYDGNQQGNKILYVFLLCSLCLSLTPAQHIVEWIQDFMNLVCPEDLLVFGWK